MAKVVAANAGAITLGEVQSLLGIIAMVITIGYTLHKWIDGIRRGRFQDTVQKK